MKISIVTTGTRSSHRLEKAPQVIPHTHPQPLQNTDNTDLQSKTSTDEISLLWLFRGC